MFFEEIHEVRRTVAADARQLINREFFLIMFIDVVDDGAKFLFLAVALGRQLLRNDIVVLKEQVEELVELGFELKFIVFLLTITCLHSGQQALTNFLIGLISRFDDVDKVQLSVVKRL